MTLKTLTLVPELTLLHDPGNAAFMVCGYTSDLLSDVVANCPPESVLITLQAHVNTVAVCTLVGAAAILVCGGRSVPEDMLAAVRRENIALLSTTLNQFEASVAVHAALAASGRSSA